MKTYYLCGSGVGVLLLAGTASAAYQGMSADLHASSAYGDTYRIYVDLDAGDRLDAVYGSGEHGLVLGGPGLYQNGFGGNMSTNINPLLYGSFPSLYHDSWVTIGLQDSDNGNALSQQGVDFSNFGDEVTTSNGSWYVTPDDAQGAEIGGRVLIAQLTISGGGSDSDLYGNLNFQGKLADGSNWGATDQWLPAPGALALLGLAGIAGRRRRRA
jgi:MYXO-CTERM domain-containing protein